MEIKKTELKGTGVKLILEKDSKQAARVFLYILNNDLHKQLFGFMEDLFVEEEFRGQGIGRMMTEEVIAEAKRRGCYKLVCTSRNSNEQVHEMYKAIGFLNYGLEFRINLDD
ncbi:MAG: GNAT family N-acetyltransferase [Nanoarchaeota archaeon]|nr:GNAT family N-acetyltransferase [Nanoarchaeota archaeon]MBU1644511.1 GNAT family N-acetyltransferase [Nanoarchaeota archaeon]MBU1976892.1 GNAT family N-acetyltransferase [Nanoarchaeota archaeon]